MIVRDEAANLPACLRSCADLVDELVIVDTGSADETKEIARSFGAKVFHFAWCDDFSAARNESLRHASGEWILWMDADDRLDTVNRGRLKELLDGLGKRVEQSHCAYVMTVAYRDACGAIPSASQVRLFPAGTVRWLGRVHEEMVLDDHVQPVLTSVAIEHVGYQDREVMRRKSERNLRLLQRKLAEMPDDPRTLFQFAGELLNADRAAEAYPLFCRAADLATPAAQWYAVAMYGRALASHRMGVFDKDAVAWLVGRRARAERLSQAEEASVLLSRLRAQGLPC